MINEPPMCKLTLKQNKKKKNKIEKETKQTEEKTNKRKMLTWGTRRKQLELLKWRLLL